MRLLLPVLLLLPSLASAADPGPSPEAVRAAAEKALPLIQKSVAEYPKHRDCFSCHHQAVPTIALALAKSKGFAVDPKRIEESVELAESDLRGAAESYRKGSGQGGGATRAGYALWTLDAGGHARDETTDAVVAFFLKRDKDRGPWRTSSKRPPSEASDVTSTAVALRGLTAFARPDQADAVADRVSRARAWLEAVEPKDTEERVFRLWGLKFAGSDESKRREAAADLLKVQRDDGSWSQLPDRDGDAYATGSSLVALAQAGGLSPDDPAYRRGLAFLIRTQRDDGSWYVKSRSRPFQTYFESGFPHKADQFISMAASSWATAALVIASPPK